MIEIKNNHNNDIKTGFYLLLKKIKKHFKQNQNNQANFEYISDKVTRRL